MKMIVENGQDYYVWLLGGVSLEPLVLSQNEAVHLADLLDSGKPGRIQNDLMRAKWDGRWLTVEVNWGHAMWNRFTMRPRRARRTARQIVSVLEEVGR